MNELEFEKSHVWHPYASLANPPPVQFAIGAHGTEITLADGRELTDAVSSWWCVAHGHNHPAIVEAIRLQSEKMCHVMFGGFTHEPAIELAERLSEITPPGLNRIFFADSGSISVEVATKMAVQYQHAKCRPDRTKMVALKGGYHGDTCGAMALSDPDGMHVLFRGIMPHHFFAEKPAVAFDDEWRASDFDSFRKVVEEHKDEIAGFICEPVFQAANAMNFYNPQYLREMRKLADEYDFALVFDEIAAGFYRTGTRWAADHAGVVPDIMCVGKALTGGHITMAATIASERVADVISHGSPSAFMHGPTYMANPLACAAAIASLGLFASSDYAEKVRAIEAHFKAELPKLKSLPNVRDVRILGAAGVIETNSLPSQGNIQRVIEEHGVWLRPFCNFIYAMPPFVTTPATMKKITDAMADLASCPPGPPPSDGDFHE